MKKRATETRKRERGSILATSAIGMLAVLLAVGMGIDISRLYLSKAELQNAADAAALAAVSGLNGQPAGITDAVNRAVTVMNKYDFNKTGVQVTANNVLFAVNLNGDYMPASQAALSPTNIRFVQVTTPELPVGMSFAALVLAALGIGFKAAPWDVVLIICVTTLTLLSVAYYLVEWVRHMSTLDAGH